MTLQNETWGGSRAGIQPTRSAAARFMRVLLAASIPLAACRPGVFSEPTVGVEFLDPWKAEDVLRQGTDVTIRVQAEYELPVAEVKVEFPAGVESWSTAILFDDSWFQRSYQHRGRRVGDGPWVNLTRGEIPLGEIETFGMFINIPEARVGESYAFPVILTLSDSSKVRWDGPPGSERPAPTLSVGESPPRASVRVGAALVSLALLVLFVTGLYWIRQRRSHRS
jgi:hypothetical protein